MKIRFTLAAVLVAVVFCGSSFGALNAYMRLKGETQGDIKGSVTQAGREDSIMVIAWNHGVTSPRDAASGLPTGKRQHEPLQITKELDRSTPLLMTALVSNERITDLELRCWEPSSSGKEVQFYTIKLYDAYIVGIRQEMLNNKYPENMQHKEREHIAFVYRRVEWIFEDGGIMAEDDWAFEGGSTLVTDVTGDGLVNARDLAVMASEWLMYER